MSLSGCWRLAGVVPRLLWAGSVPYRTIVPAVWTFVDAQRGCRKLLVRRFSSEPPRTDVTYEQLKQLLADRTAVVIDVREPWELREYGFIPESVNVPLGQVSAALQLDPEEFREKYDSEMPRQTDNIIFTCLAGVRSRTALHTATSLGYKDVQHYPGGWQDWANHEEHK